MYEIEKKVYLSFVLGESRDFGLIRYIEHINFSAIAVCGFQHPIDSKLKPLCEKYESKI